MKPFPGYIRSIKTQTSPSAYIIPHHFEKGKTRKTPRHITNIGYSYSNRADIAGRISRNRSACLRLYLACTGVSTRLVPYECE